MAYTLPVFNLTANVWNAGKNPAADDPDWEGVSCQFYIYSRHSTDIQPCELELYTPVVQVRLPIAAAGPWVDGQIWEVEAGSERYYRARWKERLHYGFVNEYLVVIVVQCNAEGLPLIRDIENAEPCGEPAPPEGGGAVALSLDAGAEGEGSVAGPSAPTGSGTELVIIFNFADGAGTVT